MFDPLSNFKLNKILSAVNALPTTLASSFTEVKNAIAGVQNTTNTIDGKVDVINTGVSSIVNESYYERNLVLPKEDLLNFKSKSYSIGTNTGEIKVVDISGSGILVCVEAKLNAHRSDTIVRCDVVIDGKVIRSTLDKQGVLSFVLVSNLYISQTESNPLTRYLAHDEVSKGITFTNENVRRIFDGYLKFDNSLVIKAYKNDSNESETVEINAIYALL